MTPLFRCDRVSLPGPRRARLEDVTVEIAAGRTAVIGPSGAGKTSLLNVLARFEQPAAGRVEHLIPNTRRLPLFWSPADGGLWPGVSMADHLRLVMPEAGDETAIQRWLTLFDLDSAAGREVEDLSAGERSRLSAARALAADAEVLVLDEPLVHVDRGRLERLWRVICETCDSRGTSLVYSTHDLESSRHADRVVTMDGGRVTGAVVNGSSKGGP